MLPLRFALTLVLVTPFVECTPPHRVREPTLTVVPVRDEAAYEDVTREAYMLPPSPEEDAGDDGGYPLATWFDLSGRPDYASAFHGMRRAYEATGNAALLFYLGRVAERLGSPGVAYAYLGAYLDAESRVDRRRADAARILNELEAHTGWLGIRCEVGIARIVVDDAFDLTRPGGCPFARRVRVGAGLHVLRARLHDGAERVANLDVDAKAMLAVHVCPPES